MMLNVASLILCLAMLLKSVDLLHARPNGHGSPKVPQHSINSEVSKNDVKCENGRFNAEVQECVCESGFSGRHCEIEIVESRRCEVRSAHIRAHQHSTECSSGMWCVPDNINCYFYACRKTMGWCVPYATDLGRDASEETSTSELMENDPGTVVE